MSRGGAGLERLLAPRSVAVVGASDDPTRIGGRPVAYLKAGGFAGPVYPVNPRRETVQGLPAYPSLAALPQPVDVALLALPAAATLAAVEACAAAGAGACVVFSSDFAETGPEGAALQRRLAETARAGGVRLLGPNCLGLFDTESGFYGTFTTTLDRGVPASGSLSIVSQSGAFGSHLYFLARELGLGLRRWITTGNEADVSVAECLLHLADDPGTETILAYVEGVGDGALLVEALERARAAGKPVIFIKVGRSEVGAEAASSHTAALAGSDAIFDSVLRRCGAWRAQSIEAAMDLAYALSFRRLPRGRRLALVTISGGVGVLMADAAQDLGLAVPALADETQASLKRLLPFAGTRNPVDITAQAFNDLGLFRANLEVILEATAPAAGQQGGAAAGEAQVDAVLAFFTSVPGSAALRGPVMEALAALRERRPEAPLLLSMLVPADMRADCEALGLPVFADPARALAAILALAHFAEALGRPPAPRPAPPPVARPPGALGEHEAKRLLAEAGVAAAEERLARSAAEAVATFEALGGGPVVLKLASPDIAHKTEIGGVLLDLRDARAVAEGYDLLLARAAEKAPQARLDGVLVARQLSGGLECIAGVQRDPVFGPVVMLGLGGVFAEILHDVTFRPAPLEEAEALAMIGELRGAALFDGPRGTPPLDKTALARALTALSRLAAAADWIESIEINPLLVLPEGVAALDALVVPRGED